MERKEGLWDRELWTQSEVAEYFRVVSWYGKKLA